MTPILHISDSVPIGSKLMISGEMNSGVPNKTLTGVFGVSVWANPKSINFIRWHVRDWHIIFSGCNFSMILILMLNST